MLSIPRAAKPPVEGGIYDSIGHSGQQGPSGIKGSRSHVVTPNLDEFALAWPWSVLVRLRRQSIQQLRGRRGVPSTEPTLAATTPRALGRLGDSNGSAADVTIGRVDLGDVTGSLRSSRNPQSASLKAMGCG